MPLAARAIRTIRGMDDTISLGLLLPVGKAQWGEGTDPRELVGLAVAAEQAGL